MGVLDKKEDDDKEENLYTFSSPPVVPGESTRPDVFIKFQAVSWAHTCIGSQYVKLNSWSPLSYVRRRIKKDFKNLFENGFMFLARNKEVLKNMEEITTLFDILPKLPLGKPVRNFQFPDVRYTKILVNYDGKRYPITVACVVFLFEQSRVSHWDHKELREQLSAKHMQGFSFIPTDIISWKESLVEKRATTLHMLAAVKLKTKQDIELEDKKLKTKKDIESSRKFNTTQDFESAIQQLAGATTAEDLRDNRLAGPLHYAAENGNLDRCELIITILGKEHIYVRDINDKTPLHCAIYRKKLDVVAYLLQLDPDLFCLDVHGNCCFDLLTNLSEKDMDVILPKLRADCLDDLFALHLTCFTMRKIHSVKEIRKKVVRSALVLARNVNVMNQTLELGRSLLHLATDLGDKEVLETLLRRGYNVLQKDCAGYLAFHYACRTGNEDVLPVLYHDDIEDSDICLGICLALRQKKYNICKSLAAFRQNITFDAVTLRYILTLLDEKLETCGLNMLPLMKQYPRLLDTFLGQAARLGLEKIIDMLLKNGANINAQDLMGRSALHESSQTGHLKIVKFLIQNGVDPNLTDWRKSTPLHYACAAGDISVTKFLLKQENVLTNLQDSCGRTPLLVAMDRKRNTLVELMITQHVSRVELFVTDVYGYNCIHYATNLDSSTSVLLLDSLPKDWKEEPTAHDTQRKFTVSKAMITAWYRGEIATDPKEEPYDYNSQSPVTRVSLKVSKKTAFKVPVKQMWKDRIRQLQRVIQKTGMSSPKHSVELCGTCDKLRFSNIHACARNDDQERHIIKVKAFKFHRKYFGNKLDPVHVAVRGQSAALVKKLAKLRPDMLKSHDSLKRIPSEVAINKFSVEMLRSSWSDTIDTAPELFYRTVCSKAVTARESESKYKMVEFFISKELPLSKELGDIEIDGMCHKDLKKFTLIEIAAKKNELKLVKLFLTKATNIAGSFALHFALHNGNEKMVEALLASHKGKTSDVEGDTRAAKLGMGLLQAACSSPQVKKYVLQHLIKHKPDILYSKKMFTQHLLEKERPGFKLGFASPFDDRFCKTPVAKLLSPRHKLSTSGIKKDREKAEDIACFLIDSGIYMGQVRETKTGYLNVACETFLWAVYGRYWVVADRLVEKYGAHMWEYGFLEDSGKEVKEIHKLKESIEQIETESFLKCAVTMLCIKNAPNTLLGKFLESGRKVLDNFKDKDANIHLDEIYDDDRYELSKVSDSFVKFLACIVVLISASEHAIRGLMSLLRTAPVVFPHIWVARRILYKRDPDNTPKTLFYRTAMHSVLDETHGATLLQIACFHENENIVREVLNGTFSPDINIRTEKHGTSLDIAAARGKIDIFRLLVDRGAVPSNETLVACVAGDDFYGKDSPGERLRWHRQGQAVIETMKIKIAKELIVNRSDVHVQYRNKNLGSAVEICMRKRLWKLLDLILSRPIQNFYHLLGEDRSCLETLFQFGPDDTCLKVIQRMKSRIEQNEKTTDIWSTVLLSSAKHQSQKVFISAFENLESANCEINWDKLLFKKDASSCCVLHHLARNGYTKSLDLVLCRIHAGKHSTDILTHSRSYEQNRATPLWHALANRNWETAILLLLNGADAVLSIAVPDFCPKRSVTQLLKPETTREHYITECPRRSFPDIHNNSTHLKLCIEYEKNVSKKMKVHSQDNQLIAKEKITKKINRLTEVSTEEKKLRYILQLSIFARNEGTTLLNVACTLGDATLVDEILASSPTSVILRDTKNMPAFAYAIANGSVGIQNKVRDDISAKEMVECLELFIWHLIHVRNLEKDVYYSLTEILRIVKDNTKQPTAIFCDGLSCTKSRLLSSFHSRSGLTNEHYENILKTKDHFDSILSIVRKHMRLPGITFENMSTGNEVQLKAVLQDMLMVLQPHEISDVHLFFFAVVGEPWLIECLNDALQHHQGISRLDSAFPFGISFLDLLLLCQRTRYSLPDCVVKSKKLAEAIRIICPYTLVHPKPETLRMAARKDLWEALSVIANKTFEIEAELGPVWQNILHLGCGKGKTEFVKSVMDNLEFAKLSSDDKTCFVANMCIACLQRRKDVVMYLLKHNVPCSEISDNSPGQKLLGSAYKKGWLTVHYAVQGNDKEIVEIIIRASSFHEIKPSPAQVEELLQISAKRGNVDVMHRIIKYDGETNSNVHSRKLHGSLFGLAASKGHEKLCLQLLEDMEFDILASLENERNALHYAALYGMQDLIQAVIQKIPESIGMKDGNDFSPLDYACAMGNSFCFEFYNQSMLAKDFGQNNELEYFGWFKRLMTTNEDLAPERTDSIRSSGRCLHPLTMVGMLQSADDIAATMALSAGKFSLMRYLRSTNEVPIFLNVAAGNGCMKFLETFVKILQKFGEDVSFWLTKEKNHMTPMACAVKNQQVECVRFLLSQNVDANVALDIPYENILHIAVRTENKEIVQLIASTVDKSLTKSPGNKFSSPEVYAAGFGLQEILSIITRGDGIHVPEHSTHRKTVFTCVECLLDCCFGWSKKFLSATDKETLGGLRRLNTTQEALSRGFIKTRDSESDPSIQSQSHKLEMILQWCHYNSNHDMVKSAIVAMGYDTRLVTAPYYLLSPMEPSDIISKLVAKGFVTEALIVMKQTLSIDPQSIYQSNALFIAAASGKTDMFTGIDNLKYVTEQTIDGSADSLFETALAFGHIKTAHVISDLTDNAETKSLKEIQDALSPSVQWLSHLCVPGNDQWHDSFLDVDSRLNHADIWLITASAYEEYLPNEEMLKNISLRPSTCNERKLNFDIESFRKHKRLVGFQKTRIEALVASSLIFGHIQDFLSNEDTMMSSTQSVQIRCLPYGASEQPKTYLEASGILYDTVRIALIDGSIVVIQDPSLRLKALEMCQKEKVSYVITNVQERMRNKFGCDVSIKIDWRSIDCRKQSNVYEKILKALSGDIYGNALGGLHDTVEGCVNSLEDIQCMFDHKTAMAAADFLSKLRDITVRYCEDLSAEQTSSRINLSGVDGYCVWNFTIVKGDLVYNRRTFPVWQFIHLFHTAAVCLHSCLLYAKSNRQPTLDMEWKSFSNVSNFNALVAFIRGSLSSQMSLIMHHYASLLHCTCSVNTLTIRGTTSSHLVTITLNEDELLAVLNIREIKKNVWSAKCNNAMDKIQEIEERLLIQTWPVVLFDAHKKEMKELQDSHRKALRLPIYYTIDEKRAIVGIIRAQQRSMSHPFNYTPVVMDRCLTELKTRISTEIKDYFTSPSSCHSILVGSLKLPTSIWCRFPLADINNGKQLGKLLVMTCGDSSKTDTYKVMQKTQLVSVSKKSLMGMWKLQSFEDILGEKPKFSTDTIEYISCGGKLYKILHKETVRQFFVGLQRKVTTGPEVATIMDHVIENKMQVRNMGIEPKDGLIFNRILYFEEELRRVQSESMVNFSISVNWIALMSQDATNSPKRFCELLGNRILRSIVGLIVDLKENGAYKTENRYTCERCLNAISILQSTLDKLVCIRIGFMTDKRISDLSFQRCLMTKVGCDMYILSEKEMFLNCKDSSKGKDKTFPIINTIPLLQELQTKTYIINNISVDTEYTKVPEQMRKPVELKPFNIDAVFNQSIVNGALKMFVITQDEAKEKLSNCFKDIKVLPSPDKTSHVMFEDGILQIHISWNDCSLPSLLQNICRSLNMAFKKESNKFEDCLELQIKGAGIAFPVVGKNSFCLHVTDAIGMALADEFSVTTKRICERVSTDSIQIELGYRNKPEKVVQPDSIDVTDMDTVIVNWVSPDDITSSNKVRLLIKKTESGLTEVVYTRLDFQNPWYKMAEKSWMSNVLAIDRTGFIHLTFQHQPKSDVFTSDEVEKLKYRCLIRGGQYYCEHLENRAVYFHCTVAKRRCPGVGPLKAFSISRAFGDVYVYKCHDSLREVTLKAICAECREALIVHTPFFTVPASDSLKVNKPDQPDKRGE